ncbi:MAG: DedA family protein [Candidatus Methylomirabilota bacterium]|jgi:membrane protein DedA with SNARE-associated domain
MGFAELQQAVACHGALVVGLSILGAELGVPMPLPNELVLAWAGYLVGRGDINIWGVLSAAMAADQAGSLFFYIVIRTGGRALVDRYGKWILLTRARLGLAEVWLARVGPLAYFVGRIVPFLRIYSSGAAGLLRLPYGTVLPVGLLASLVWTAGFLALGMAVGEQTEAWLSGWHPHAGLLLVSIVLALGLSLALAHHLRKKVKHHANHDWQ